MSDVRRFDHIERVVRDERAELDDTTASVLMRIATHRHTPSGIEVVASTGTATNVYTGKVILNTTDFLLYRYTGSAWEAFLALGGTSAATRHEVRYEQTTIQSITNATDTKIQFHTASLTSDDVTASGTNNQDFLLNRGGLWRISAGLRLVAGTTGERHIFLGTGTVVGTLANRIAGNTVPGSTLAISLSVSTEYRVTASTSVFAGVFQSNGGSLNTDVGFGHTAHIALTWLRP